MRKYAPRKGRTRFYQRRENEGCGTGKMHLDSLRLLRRFFSFSGKCRWIRPPKWHPDSSCSGLSNERNFPVLDPHLSPRDQEASTPAYSCLKRDVLSIAVRWRTKLGASSGLLDTQGNEGRSLHLLLSLLALGRYLRVRVRHARAHQTKYEQCSQRDNVG